ncbi:unnamed protein product [Clonostachys byssicola]|uniref:Major facilitator superfamily (MFS) profile domain-containing protein n=1 Tax=Clonostachys byssicola TaxID=160290 RepID=A0A9N9U3W3_9HYPO|nr:unnamed protein product [Clonostachys byssicola]
MPPNNTNMSVLEASAPDKTDESTHHEEPPRSFIREALLVSVLCSSQLMTQAGLALSLVPLRIIGASFNTTNPGELSWYTASYSLTVGTFILIAGRLGDIFGHRLMFIIGFAWFSLWSLLGGIAVWSDQIFFDICRAMQGIGPAFLLPNSIAILGRTYRPGPRKNMIFSLFGATAPGGFSIGAAMASLLAERVWWPWAYWIMAIACAGLALMGWLIIPQSPPDSADEKDIPTMARLDIPGSFAGVTGLILVNFAWNQGPVVGWDAPYTYALLIVGILMLGIFVYIELHSRCPLLPPSIFTKEVGWVLGCVATGWSSFGILVFYYFQFLEVIKGDTPLLASAKWSGVSISGAIAAVTTGYLISHIRPSLIMLMAMVAFTMGQILLATLPVDQTYWAQAFVITIITPWGMDMSFPSGTLILSNSLPREQQGVAASVVNTVVNYSISIGLGLAGTVERYVNVSGQDTLASYRATSYMGTGLAGLGILTASLYVILDHRRRDKASS